MEMPGLPIAPALQQLGPPLELVAKATVLLAASLLGARLLRRSSAATRHLAWALGVVGVLALPLLGRVVPAWRVEVPVAAVPAPTAPSRVQPAPGPIVGGTGLRPFASGLGPRTPEQVPTEARAPFLPWKGMGDTLAWLVRTVLVAWAAGSFLALARLASSLRKAAAMVRHGRDLDTQEHVGTLARDMGMGRVVRLVESGRASVPMTFGALRPVIVVPEGFGDWEPARRRAVLLHELAHVRRNDWLVQCLAQAASVAFWFHPLVRMAERRLRFEAEQAADDLVLAHGTRASSYAAHLVGLVRSMQAVPRSNLMTLSMIGGPFDGRIRAILDGQRARGPVRAGAGAVLTAAAACVLFACSAVDVTARPSGGSTWQEIHAEMHETVHDAIAWWFGLEPSSAGGWYDRGMRLHEQGQYDEAIAAFQKSIDMGKDPGAPTYNIACGHALLGHADLAFAWLDKAAEAGFPIGDYLHSDQDLASLRDEPRFARLADDAGRDERERLERRIAKLRGDPSQDAGKWADVGMELYHHGDYALAADALARSAELGPASGNLLYNLACSHSLAGHAGQALDALERAIEAGYDDAKNLAKDTDLDPIRSNPRFAALTSDLEQLRYPSDVTWLGMDLRADESSWKSAVTRFESYVREHPQSGTGWFRLGFASLRTNDPTRAVAAFKRAFDLGFRKGTSAYNVACSHARAGQADAAFEWLERAEAEGFHVADSADDDDDLESLRRDPRFSRYLSSKDHGSRRYRLL